MERPAVMHLRPTDGRWAKVEALGRLIHSESYGDIVDHALEHTLAHYGAKERAMKDIEAYVSYQTIADGTGLTPEQIEVNESNIDQILSGAIQDEFGYEDVNASLTSGNHDMVDVWNEEGNQIDPAPYTSRVQKAIRAALEEIKTLV